MFDDPYFKSRLTYELNDQSFQFDTAALLASPFAIDRASQLVLPYVADLLDTAKRIAVLGCNYGVVPVVLAKLAPHAYITALDKDLLALRYTRHNAALNGVSNLTVLGSIGVEALGEQRFDLIVAHVPSKIGDRAITHDWLLQPLAHLEPQQRYYFTAEVHLNRLVPGVARKHKLSLHEHARSEGMILYSMNHRGA
jgi:16S rRNA (guanine1207-N2)-methyltransferase